MRQPSFWAAASFIVPDQRLFPISRKIPNLLRHLSPFVLPCKKIIKVKRFPISPLLHISDCGCEAAVCGKSQKVNKKRKTFYDRSCVSSRISYVVHRKHKKLFQSLLFLLLSI